MALSILTILGSTREGRAGEKVASWFMRLAALRGDAQYGLADVRALDLPTFNEPSNPKQIEHAYADPRAQAWVAHVESADGFVVVTPEYNHGYPPALKNAFDYAYAGWNNKPIAFVSYGGIAGGTRAVEQLRQVAIELQMAPVRNQVAIPFISKAFGADGKPAQPELLATSAQAMLDQLLWWAAVLREGRAEHPVAKHPLRIVP